MQNYFSRRYSWFEGLQVPPRMAVTVTELVAFGVFAINTSVAHYLVPKDIGVRRAGQRDAFH